MIIGNFGRVFYRNLEMEPNDNFRVKPETIN